MWRKMVRILFLLIRQDVFDFSEPIQCVSCSSCWIFEIRCREFDISRLFISVCWMCELCLIWLMAWLWHRPPRQICKIANSQSWSSLQLNQCDVEMRSIQYTYWEWIIEWSRKTGCPIEINKISNYIDLWIVMRKTFCAEKKHSNTLFIHAACLHAFKMWKYASSCFNKETDFFT